MKKNYKTEDIEKLYIAFSKLCDCVEDEIGCGKCPMWETTCYSKDNANAKEFSNALSRIRKNINIDVELL